MAEQNEELELPLFDFSFMEEQTSTEEEVETTEVETTEEEEEEETAEENAGEEEETSQNEGDPYQAHINVMSEYGLWEIPDEWEYNPEDKEGSLKEVAEYNDLKRNQAIAQEFVDAAPDGFKDIIEFVAKGGTSLNEYVALSAQQEALEEIDDSDQEAFIRQFYESKGVKAKIIEGTISNLKDAEELESHFEEVKQEYADMLASEKQRIAKEEEDLRKQREEDIVAYNNQLNDVITNVKLNKKTKSMIEKSIFDPSYDRNIGNDLKNIESKPEHLVQLVALLQTAYDPKKGFDLSKVVTTTKTKKAKTTIEEKLFNAKRPSGKGGKKFNKEFREFTLTPTTTEI